MNKKEINLEEILYKIVDENPHGDRVYLKDDIIDAMKEACKQTLELAVENADINKISYMGKEYSYNDIFFVDDKNNEYEINKESILNTINQIK